MTRVWFISGCSTGLGRALAEAVVARGDRLIATARRPETLEGLVAQAPERVRALALDVTDGRSIREAAAAALAAFGRIDVLVNNAGFGLLSGAEEATETEIRAQFETNVFGLMNLTRAFLPTLRAQRSGHVLMLSSISGVAASAGLGYYDASKFAVEGFSEALAQELAPFGVKLTIVEPGPYATDWAGRSLARAGELAEYDATAGATRRMLSGPPTIRLGDPAGAANAMIAVVESTAPPLRQPLGTLAVEVIRRKLESQLAELEKTAERARSADG